MPNMIFNYHSYTHYTCKVLKYSLKVMVKDKLSLYQWEGLILKHGWIIKSIDIKLLHFFKVTQVWRYDFLILFATLRASENGGDVTIVEEPIFVIYKFDALDIEYLNISWNIIYLIILTAI